MEHKLRILVRLDIDPSSAVLEVTGCLTEAGCAALIPAIRRTASLVGGSAVIVDLSHAMHIDEWALKYLQRIAAGNLTLDAVAAHPGTNTFSIISPMSLPSCPGPPTPRPAGDRVPGKSLSATLDSKALIEAAL